MKKYDHYNFDKMVSVMGSVKEKPTTSNLKDLQLELNNFFKEKKCTEILYTHNTDKPFFGMCVIPTNLSNNFSYNVFKGDTSNKTIHSYIIEIDSKLLSPIMNLSPRELTAILLHEVGHLVNDITAQKEISNAIHYNIGKNGISFSTKEISKYPEYLDFGVFMTMIKLNSIFNKNQEEFYADEFVVDCGFGPELSKAFDRIIKSRDLVKGDQNKFITLIWSLSLYKNIKDRRLAVLELLESGKELEGSKIKQNIYNKLITHIKKSIKDSQSKFYVNEGFLDALKFSPIKSLEEDLYEFKIRINSIDDNSEAMDMLRSFNMRINLIDEYISSKQGKLEEKEIKRLIDLGNKYKIMREELIKKGSYDRQIYSIWAKYPDMKI